MPLPEENRESRKNRELFPQLYTAYAWCSMPLSAAWWMGRCARQDVRKVHPGW
jgi:hypothetical protein